MGILDFLNSRYSPQPENRFGDIGGKAGRQMLSDAKMIGQNAGNVTYNALPEFMRGGIMEPVNRAITYPVDMALAALTGATGATEKAVGYASEIIGGDTASEKRLFKDVMGGLEVAGFGPHGKLAGILSGPAMRSLRAGMNNRGQMPTVGTNFANIGHNGGPSLEPLPRPKLQDMYSPSIKAAEAMPQSKGTYEQLRAMMIKGGAKEDELEWSGFDNKFRDMPKVTKDGIITYLQHYAGNSMLDESSDTAPGILDDDSTLSSDELSSRWVEDRLDDETEYYMDSVRYDMLYGGGQDTVQYSDLNAEEAQKIADEMGFGSVELFEENLMNKFQGDDTWMTPQDYGRDNTRSGYTLHADEDEALDYTMSYESAREYADESLREQVGQMDVVDVRDELGLSVSADIGEVQYSDYFTTGVEDYTENRYQYVPPDQNLRGGTFDQSHWLEEDNLVHTRTGLFPVIGGGKTHHVGEIQSDWGQQLRKTKESTDYHNLTNPNQAGPSYRSKTFDEQAVEGRYQQARIEVGDLQRSARSAFKFSQKIADSDEAIDHINVLGDIKKYQEDVLGIPHNPNPSDGTSQLYEPNNNVLLSYLMDENSNTTIATDFRDRYGARYAEMMPDYQAGLKQNNTLSAKEGGPLISSTNKWVDFALRQELQKAINSGEDYITLGSADMASDMTMERSEGGEFYDKIVPQRMKAVLKKLDSKAKLERVTIQTGDGERNVLGLRLTDDLVRKIAAKGGIPLFSAALAAQGPASQRADQPKGNGIMAALSGT